MRLVINLILIALIAGLIWILYGSIKEPIEFQRVKEMRERAVIDKLTEIRTAQEMYRGITGFFAPNFDTLNEVLRTEEFAIIKVIGDPDDPSNTDAISYDTLYKAAIDSVKKIGLVLDSLRFVPYTKGKVFDIQADTLTYQSTIVSVVEVGTVRKNFMGKFGSERFAKYDNSYKPNSVIKFGDMNKPNTSGNWEN